MLELPLGFQMSFFQGLNFPVFFFGGTSSKQITGQGPFQLLGKGVPIVSSQRQNVAIYKWFGSQMIFLFPTDQHHFFLFDVHFQAVLMFFLISHPSTWL